MTARAPSSVAAIVGSAFSADALEGVPLYPETVPTAWGPWTLHRVGGTARPAYLSFRHGLPHRLLPHQIPYRAQAAALHAVGCGALLVTSSVGVLEAALPLYAPLRVTDLLMPDNRLPDGTACTMFPDPSPHHGHLVLTEGLFSHALGTRLETLAAHAGTPLQGDVVFGYAGGPRGKTPAENRWWAQMGAQVNSMTLAPEIVLANELEIPCVGLVVGHKYSVPGRANPDEGGVAASLDAARTAQRRLVAAFVQHASPVPFGNHVFRF